jgi:hypothetical protein
VVVPRTMWGDGGREGVIPLQANPPRTAHRRRAISIACASAEPHARLVHEPAPFGSSLPGRLTHSFDGDTPASGGNVGVDGGGAVGRTGPSLRDDAR